MGSWYLTVDWLTSKAQVRTKSKMISYISALCLVLLSVMCGLSESAPAIESPYLSILINRRDLGHSFDLGVDRSNHNLVVSGPPAPYAGFPGTSTYYQRSYGHVTPFLAFGGYKPQYLLKLMPTCDLDARVMLKLVLSMFCSLKIQ